MGKQKEHLVDARPVAITESVIFLLEKYNKNNRITMDDFSTSLFGIGAHFVGSIIPDGIEPATHPNHRGFFHSKLFAAMNAHFSFKKITNFSNLNNGDFILLQFSTGILNHLLNDSQTAKGLPFV